MMFGAAKNISNTAGFFRVERIDEKHPYFPVLDIAAGIPE